MNQSTLGSRELETFLGRRHRRSGLVRTSTVVRPINGIAVTCSPCSRVRCSADFPEAVLEEVLWIPRVSRRAHLSELPIERALGSLQRIAALVGSDRRCEEVPNASTVPCFRPSLKIHELAALAFDEVRAILRGRSLCFPRWPTERATVVATRCWERHATDDHDTHIQQVKEGRWWQLDTMFRDCTGSRSNVTQPVDVRPPHTLASKFDGQFLQPKETHAPSAHAAPRQPEIIRVKGIKRANFDNRRGQPRLLLDTLITGLTQAAAARAMPSKEHATGIVRRKPFNVAQVIPLSFPATQSDSPEPDGQVARSSVSALEAIAASLQMRAVSRFHTNPTQSLNASAIRVAAFTPREMT